MRESKIEKEVNKYAKSLGWNIYKFTSPGLKGVPDRLFLRSGIAVFIEFKAPNKIPNKIQIKRIKEIVTQGFTAKYIDNVIDGKKLFDSFENYTLHSNNFNL